MPVLAGKYFRNKEMAFSPPNEAPIATTGNGLSFFPTLSRLIPAEDILTFGVWLVFFRAGFFFNGFFKRNIAA
jgi:hypothetical protein